MEFDAGRPFVIQEEPYVRFAFADDDLVAVEEGAPVDVDGEIARRKPGQRAYHGPLKFIVRRPRADRFAHGERDEFANA